MQTDVYERLKTLKKKSGTGIGTKAEIIWCNPFSDERRFLREEEKFSKEPKTKNRKRKIFENQDSCHIHAHAHMCKSKKCCVGDVLCMYYAIEYQKIRFEPLFSVIQREKFKNGIVIGLVQNKRSDGL